MFLPNQLPTQLKHQQHQHQPTKKSRKMQRIIGRKKKAYDHADEMLAPPASPTFANNSRPAPNPVNNNSANLMARGWARISGRKRQRRKVPNLESNNTNNNNHRFDLSRRDSGSMPYNAQNGRRGSGHSAESTWPIIGANSNLARVAHLSENFSRIEEGEIEEKRHFLNRGMDRIRRSIRRSFRKGGSSGCHQLQALTQSSASTNDGGAGGGTQLAGEGPSSAGGTAKNYCHTDEIAVRSAACSFAVKYLGACEVFESRGMSVCESALQHLRTRKRATKVLLYISGDGIRVVDQENNRGLIVDQTIEKVSFCAPDRNNEKGFSYICRDGATRRWMCHGFHATKDTGERLSHAVGCAFTVCLEKKRKRDAETAAYRNAQALAHTVELDSGIEDNCGGEFARTNQGYRSFRQLSMSERRSDPQKAILVGGQALAATPISTLSNTHSMPSIASAPTMISSASSTPRPSGNPTLFERSGSLRAPISATTITNYSNASNTNTDDQLPQQQQQQTIASTFARFNSLQPKNDAIVKRRIFSGTIMPRMSLHNEPIWEGDVEEEIVGTTNDGEKSEYRINTSWNFSRANGNGRERFYRTLPHTMPSLAPTNWCTFESSITTTIPEEEKQCNPRESPSPADPFHTKLEGQGQHRQQCQPQLFASSICHQYSSIRADNWLADTLQKAASLSGLASNSADGTAVATMAQPQQMGMTMMPHSKSFVGIGCRTPAGGHQMPMAQQKWHNNDGGFKMNASTTIMPRLAGTVTSISMPPQRPPPLLPLSPPVALAGDVTDSAATTATLASGGDRAAAPVAAGSNGGAGISSRKPGRQIEYQLLQETEHPHSPPPRTRSSFSENKPTTNAVDPFDVHWSQRVLEQSAIKLRSPGVIPARPAGLMALPEMPKTIDQTFDQRSDQQTAFDQRSDQRAAFDQKNPFSNGKNAPVNV